jgi:hypothetical protein
LRSFVPDVIRIAVLLCLERVSHVVILLDCLLRLIRGSLTA